MKLCAMNMCCDLYMCYELYVLCICICVVTYICAMYMYMCCEINKKNKTVTIWALCRLPADGKGLCHQLTDGKGATWRPAVQPGQQQLAI